MICPALIRPDLHESWFDDFNKIPPTIQGPTCREKHAPFWRPAGRIPWASCSAKLTVSLEFCSFGMLQVLLFWDVCEHIFVVPKILGTAKLYHKIVALLLIQVIMAFLVCHTSGKLSCTSFQSFLTKILRFSLKLCTGAMCLCDASQNENFKPTQIIIAYNCM